MFSNNSKQAPCSNECANNPTKLKDYFKSIWPCETTDFVKHVCAKCCQVALHVDVLQLPDGSILYPMITRALSTGSTTTDKKKAVLNTAFFITGFR